MLIGRTAEVEAVTRLVADVRRGESRVLLLRGEPGVGKTSLLDAGVTAASDLRVLRARGVEAESDVAYAGLVGLLRPILHLTPALPVPHAEALGQALGLLHGPTADRFTTCVASLLLLGAAAEEGPLLVAVDDLPWVDEPSRAAILFAARRLSREGVGMVMTERESADRETQDLPTIELHRLVPTDAETLLDLRSPGLAPTVRERILVAASGNPLALIELPGLMTEPQRSGADELTDPIAPGPRITRAFTDRVRELPPATSWALLVVAAGDGATTVVSRALSSRGGLDALAPAAAADLVTIGPELIAVSHPLLRAAVYHDADPALRHAAHAALATGYEAEGDVIRAAVHRASACTGPDADVAAALEAAAEASLLRGGTVAAGRLLRRAATLSPAAEDRARRLVAAGRALVAGGAVREAAAITDLLSTSEVPDVVRADAELLRAEATSYREHTRSEVDRLAAVGEGLVTTSPPHAGALLSITTYLRLQSGDLSGAASTGRRTLELTCGLGGFPELSAAAGLGQALVLLGAYEEAEPVMRRVHELLQEPAGSDLFGAQARAAAAFVLMIVGDVATARAVLDREIASARATSALPVLPFALATSAELRVRDGELSAALAEVDEADRLARLTQQANLHGYVLAVRARVEALAGNGSAAREHARASAAAAQRLGTRSLFLYTEAALGQLSLASGGISEAVDRLETAEAHAAELGVVETNVVHWQADLAEAYLRAGRGADARSTCDDLASRAERSDRMWARASAARVLAALDADGVAFERAERLAEELGSPLELARTQLLHGEWLRRSGQRNAAARKLRAAAAAFERLGASDWLSRCTAELTALGERRDPTRSVIEGLTPQELRVAMTIGRGATNREAAASLFLTVKTIEYHLNNVYRKLNVRTRTELALLLTSRS